MRYVTSQPRNIMRAAVISLLTLSSLSGCHGDQADELNSQLSHFIADLWLEGGDVIKILWRDCSKKLLDVKDVIDHNEYFPKFLRCMKRKTLRALDRSLSTDIVPVLDGVNLVRYEMVDKSGNVMQENETSDTWSETELDEGDWRGLALHRMAKVLRTHVIKFDFGNGTGIEKVEFRGRRRHHMMTMMMFGIVSIGMVLVPMGFQFLAVLGGKALLLAKMALILASIQGLKKVDTFEGYHDRGKIAASPLSYGFYNSYPPYDHYEKRSRNDDWPSPSATAPTPPPSMPDHNPWSNLNAGNVKIDRHQIAEEVVGNTKRISKVNDVWKGEIPKAVKINSEPRLYPVYLAPTSPPFLPIDPPSPLVDLTTNPGEVQADYTLELPYNGFRFQSPTTVVSA